MWKAPKTCRVTLQWTVHSCISLGYCNILLLQLSIPVSCRFLKAIQKLLMASSSSSCHFYHSLSLPFNNVYYKAVPMQDVTNPVSLPNFLFYVRHYFPPWLFVTLLRFSHDQSNWCPPFSSTTFQNFPGTSDLLSEVSKFQHNTKLWSKYCTLLVSSLNLSPVC